MNKKNKLPIMIGSSLYEGIVGENFCLDPESFFFVSGM